MSVILASAPHTHSMFNVARTMVAVMVCLAPATAFGLYHFGLPAIFLFGVTLCWIRLALMLVRDVGRMRRGESIPAAEPVHRVEEV